MLSFTKFYCQSCGARQETKYANSACVFCGGGHYRNRRPTRYEDQITAKDIKTLKAMKIAEDVVPRQPKGKV